MQSNQLTDAKNYNVNKMIFSNPIISNIPNSTFSYQRILISTRNDNGTVGDLIIPTENVFSFGVSENRDLTTKKLNGYVMPLCLWSKDHPTEAEKIWTETFINICNRCVDHLLEVKDEIKKWDLDRSDLKKFNPLWWKRENGKIVGNSGPTLYAKLIETKADGGKILSLIYDRNTHEELDALQLLGKYCHTTAAIKIESIFIGGSRISLQVKLWEAAVDLHEKAITRLLPCKPVEPRRPSLTIDIPETGSLSDEPSP